ncbi:MAG: hypothetical protein ACE5NC_13070 [Anaerolineae bacterium]
MRRVAGIAILLGALATVGTLVWEPPGTEARRAVRIGQRAPEITGGPWINSEPLSLAKLRGRVVFVEFWTYG